MTTVQYAKFYLVKNSFPVYFVSRTILAVIDHMQKHIFPDFLFSPDFALTTLKRCSHCTRH